MGGLPRPRAGQGQHYCFLIVAEKKLDWRTVAPTPDQVGHDGVHQQGHPDARQPGQDFALTLFNGKKIVLALTLFNGKK